MDEVGKRLHEAAEKCIKSYEAWQADKKNLPARESLNETLHELRRATAALEIDMIREERLSGSARPMPTPGHRAMRGRDDDDSGNANDDIGNRGGNDEGGGSSGGHERGPRRSGGRPGGHRQGGHRNHGGGGQREGNGGE